MSFIQKGKRFFSQHKYKILATVSFALAGYAFYQYATDQSRIKLSAFLQALQNKQLDEVVLRGRTIFFKSQLSDWYYTYIGNYPFAQMFNLLKSAQSISFSCQEEQSTAQLLSIFLGAAGITMLALKNLVPETLGKFNKQARLVHNNEKFDHFYGNQEIKAKLKELVDYIKHAQKYQKLGGRIRKGILLYGPPGTGKTMLAKTLANQAQISFIQTCASEFEQIYVGVGPKKIRDLFDRARACKEGCIIFIDQLDAIGSRSQGMRFSRQTTATINQLLSQLDGFEANKNIFVIASTNRLDLVDAALIRAGRFDVKIKLNLPNKEQRKGILKILLRKKEVPHQISEQAYDKISQMTSNWSGADFETLINEGIYKAVRKNMATLQTSQLLQALNQLTYK